MTEILQRPQSTKPPTTTTTPSTTTTTPVTTTTSTTTTKSTTTVPPTTTTIPTTTTTIPTTTTTLPTTTTTSSTSTTEDYMTEEPSLEFDTSSMLYSLSNQIGLMEEKLDLCKYTWFSIIISVSKFVCRVNNSTQRRIRNTCRTLKHTYVFFWLGLNLQSISIVIGFLLSSNV